MSFRVLNKKTQIKCILTYEVWLHGWKFRYTTKKTWTRWTIWKLSLGGLHGLLRPVKFICLTFVFEGDCKPLKHKVMLWMKEHKWRMKTNLVRLKLGSESFTYCGCRGSLFSFYSQTLRAGEDSASCMCMRCFLLKRNGIRKG